MSDNQSTPEELLKIERSLRGLAPSAGSFDRDALMFAAGRQSAPRARGVSPMLTMLVALLGVGLGVGLSQFRSSPVVEFAESVAPVTDPELEASSTIPTYLIARNQLLQNGVVASATEPASGSTHELERSPLRWQRVGDLEELFDTNLPNYKHPG
jgi:hypothetical protein